MALTLVVSVFIAALALLLGDVFVGIFTPESSPVYTLVRIGFYIFPFAFLFSGINILTSAMFTALSNGTISAILAVSRNLLIALGILAFPRLLGVNGVWLAVPFAELVSLAMAIVFIVKNRKRYHYA